MMAVALILFLVVILACLVAPSGTPAKRKAEAKQPALQMGEARA